MNMSLTPTPEQQLVIDAPLGPQCVLACAGSGKTVTAVRRLREIRRRLGFSPAYVALLSYSNVAVDTFRSEYDRLNSQGARLSRRVLIGTVDSFITSQLVLPHATRMMGCARQPFLVRGGEPFLKAHTIYNGKYPAGIETLRIIVDPTGKIAFALRPHNGPVTVIPNSQAEAAIMKLTKVGAYTHELGRYWAFRVLSEQGRFAEVLARRYPHILVDEAQDVGSLHGALLRMLQSNGSAIALIGDPNQAIFEFADADGTSLKEFSMVAPVQMLLENRRSVGAIVAVANALSGASSQAIRPNPGRKCGAYVIPYDPAKPKELIETFATMLKANGYASTEAVVLCRGRSMVNHLSGGSDQAGKGATEKFACAAICRDRQRNVVGALELLAEAVLKLLDHPPASLKREILGPSPGPVAITLKRLLWSFLRNPARGLPSADLPAKSQWQPTLKERLPNLLDAIEESCGLKRSATWTNNVTAGQLCDEALCGGDYLDKDAYQIPVRTVHEVKGEGINAVLYVTKRGDVASLLSGPTTEEGRIGYVAVTRAKDLLVMAVPESIAAAVMTKVKAAGFAPWTDS